MKEIIPIMFLNKSIANTLYNLTQRYFIDHNFDLNLYNLPSGFKHPTIINFPEINDLVYIEHLNTTLINISCEKIFNI